MGYFQHDKPAHVGAGLKQTVLVDLREALSSQNTPLATLFRTDKDTVTERIRPTFPQVNGVNLRDYRMNRRPSPTDRAQLAEQYLSGTSTYELARQFGINRHTIAKHLRHQGVGLRPQRKMTPSVTDRAKRLYADGHSLAAIGNQLGVDASTVHKALKRAGLKLRDTHGRPT
jgi:DNA-binding CsgD family transcriptional regulator